MAEHRKAGSSTARTRAEIARVRAELRAVTDAISPPGAPQFSVVETGGDGETVVRPGGRRRAVREALRGSRYPAVVLPLALAWRAVKWPLLHLKAGVAGSKLGLALTAGLVAMAVPVSGAFADYVTAVPRHPAVSQLPTAPAAAVAPVVLHHHAHRMRLHRDGRAWNPRPLGRTPRPVVVPVTPVPVPGAPGGGLPTVQPTVPVPTPTLPVPSPTLPAVPPVPHLVRHLLHDVTHHLPLPGRL